jgi:HlyD family secretion protein
VAALGRIEPGLGAVRVAGPPRPAVVIERLFVEEGDRVHRGQELAALAGIGVQRAEVARLRAELANAEREIQRNRELRRGRVLSESDWQALELARDVARARLEGAGAELELSTVRSPIDGQVLEIHAREGERVGAEGIAELGDTARMYAVAEIYETDIGRVRSGQRGRDPPELPSVRAAPPLPGRRGPFVSVRRCADRSRHETFAAHREERSNRSPHPSS